MVDKVDFKYDGNLEIKSIFSTVLDRVKPSVTFDSEKKSDVKFVIDRIIKKLDDLGYNAEVRIGGSFGKGTYLKTGFDVDCFVRFKNYDDSKLSDMLDESLNSLRKVGIEIMRVHGSRDYFQFKYHEIDFELVPVNFIESFFEMVNSTDLSSLHVDYILNKAKVMSGLQNEIRLAKQFFKGSKCYGAESYIRGFSGHVIDLLIVKYGSLIELLRVASLSWIESIDLGKSIIIDLEDNLKKLPSGIDDSKINSSLVIVDPIQMDRNSSAALSDDVLLRFISFASDFLVKPSIDFFVPHHLTENELLNLPGNIISVMCYFDRNKRDIVGSKALKIYEFLLKQFKILDFNVLNSDFEFFDNGSYSLMYFKFDSFIIDKEFIKIGPPIHVTNACEHFNNIHGDLVYTDVDSSGISRLYAKLNRKYFDVFNFVNDIKLDKEFILKNCTQFIILNKNCSIF